MDRSGRAVLGGSAVLTGACSSTGFLGIAGEKRPNVILIMTDDQGFGDLGFHGNEKIQTPNLDRLARESTRLEQFHVCPVCAPTRASLMTGRYNYRTGVVDTYIGRAMMHSDEVTIAEMLGAAGYRTGIFGKWHLGDNYPLRAMDQGFQTALVHNGGGMGQPGDPPETDFSRSYDDPIISHNGVYKKTEGYCTDIFCDATIQFIEENRDRPFFAYLSTNAPHTPLFIDESYVKPYREMGLDETTAKIYGMVTNIDENIGRLLAKLRELNLEDDTIVIFITDNGPQQDRYNASMRGRKGTVYEGGLRVPCFMRWPGKFQAGKTIDRLAGHIDIVPTLLNVCGAKRPSDVELDGRDLMPLLTGDPARANWRDRAMFFQWHRGDRPEPFKHSAVRTQRYKLVNGEELYDLSSDPLEKKEIAAKRPEVVAQLRRTYEEWFQDVSSTRGYAPPRMHLGTRHENPVVLSRQDWRGPRAGWGKKSVGYWEVYVAATGKYAVKLWLPELAEDARVTFRLGGTVLEMPVKKGTKHCTFEDAPLRRGDGRLEAWVSFADRPKETVGMRYVEVKKEG